MDTNQYGYQEIAERLARIEVLLQDLVEQPKAKEWYTTQEVAKLLGKRPFTVREWCRLGRIHATKRQSGRGDEAEWAISAEELARIRNFGLLPVERPYRYVK